MEIPFPGIDPYLEQPGLWPNLHTGLITGIRDQLQAELSGQYVALITPYVTLESIEITPTHQAFIPDVGILREGGPESGSAPSTIAAPPLTLPARMEVPTRYARIEIRSVLNQTLITTIELLSPANKRPSQDRAGAYEKKRQELFASEVHLLEIDLLRGGVRPQLARPLPAAAYFILLSRAYRRPLIDVWPVALAEPLPVVPVPLIYPDPDVALDLGRILRQIYRNARYERSAVLLFVERARRVQGDFALTPANAAAVGQTCRLVDGTPLAIKLAASWLPTLSPAEVAAELSRSLDLLDSAARDRPARHRSVRTVFDGSWRLLQADEQQLLARLALFRGGFTREAAEFVAGARLPQLATLIQKSLLRRQGERYQIHELIRQFALERLRAGSEAEPTSERFVAYYRSLAAQLAAQLTTEGKLNWIGQLAEEADNLRAALRAALTLQQGDAGASLCMSLYALWAVRGMTREGLQWVEQFLALKPLSALAHGRLLTIAELMQQLLGAWARALESAEQALSLLPTDDDTARPMATYGAGLAALDQGDFATARHYLTASLAYANNSAQQATSAAVLAITGLTYYFEGRPAEARGHYQQALELASAAQVVFVIAYTTYGFGALAVLEGDPEGAAQLREALVVFQRYDYKILVAYCLETLAAQAGILGDHARAGLLHGAAEQLRATHHLVVPPGIQPMYQRLVALARGPLEAPAWEQARSAGRQLSQAEAVKLALDEA
ncbi:MAG: DUF4058 family protein [Oscillochloridaceae bacterium umkhey_bin13]